LFFCVKIMAMRPIPSSTEFIFPSYLGSSFISVSFLFVAKECLWQSTFIHS
jgi:hypothetical protein